MVSNLLNDMIAYTISTLKKLLQYRMFQNNNLTTTECIYVDRCCISYLYINRWSLEHMATWLSVLETGVWISDWIYGIFIHKSRNCK
jgi:hypothetical protein